MKMIVTFLLLFVSPIQQDTILFVGDSMTSYQKGWHYQLSTKLNIKYNNLSSPGKRTDWMLTTLKTHLSTKQNYKVCFIYGGINDGFSSVKPETALKNMQSIVDLCNYNGIKPVVVVGYNPDVVMVDTYVKDNETKYRERYKTIQNLFLTKLTNCKIIPIDNSITRLDSDDGIHFKASGHRKFSEWVYQNYSK